jgi:hypothetical protein
MKNNYNSLSPGTSTRLKNELGEFNGSPPTNLTKFNRLTWISSMVLIIMLFFSSGNAWSQISLPYSETFSGIAAANGFPTVTGGAWTRSGTTTNQPTYITNTGFYNQSGNGDTKYICHRYNSGTRYFFVGPFRDGRKIGKKSRASFTANSPDLS